MVITDKQAREITVAYGNLTIRHGTELWEDMRDAVIQVLGASIDQELRRMRIELDRRTDELSNNGSELAATKERAEKAEAALVTANARMEKAERDLYLRLDAMEGRVEKAETELTAAKERIEGFQCGSVARWNVSSLLDALEAGNQELFDQHLRECWLHFGRTDYTRTVPVAKPASEPQRVKGFELTADERVAMQYGEPDSYVFPVDRTLSLLKAAVNRALAALAPTEREGSESAGDKLTVEPLSEEEECAVVSAERLYSRLKTSDDLVDIIRKRFPKPDTKSALEELLAELCDVPTFEYEDDSSPGKFKCMAATDVWEVAERLASAIKAEQERGR